MINKKAYLQMSFAWIFAIIVGAFILFLAIYAVTKLIKTEETVQDLKASKEIEILLNPLETSFETGKSTSFIMPAESRIYNKCNDDENLVFGRQLISVSQRSFNKWTETSIDGSKDIGSSNKYIFSDEYVEGRQFYVFSKPFEFPFKVADLIYMTSSKDNYCFVDAPSDIEDEIKTISRSQKNLFYEDCPDSDMIEICFQSSGCDVNVYYDEDEKSGYVGKDNERLDFETDALMYAAIFAEPDVYECQVNRLLKRIEQLALLYDDKATIISQEAGCSSNLDLSVLASTAATSDSISSLNSYVDDIQNKNKLAMCRLW